VTNLTFKNARDRWKSVHGLPDIMRMFSRSIPDGSTAYSAHASPQLQHVPTQERPHPVGRDIGRQKAEVRDTDVRGTSPFANL